MSVVSINKNNFEEVKNSEKKVLIDFYADWCGPCQMIAPILEEIDKENSEICVCKVNVDENGELAGAFGVQYIPYLVVIKDGAITHQSSGVKSKEQILDLFK
jgi:thioredoxin 1